MQVKDVYTPEVVCCSRATDARAAACMMRQHHVGALVVVNDVQTDRAPIGILTDRDLVIEVLAQGRDPKVTRVDALTRKPVVIAQESEEVEAVLERMRTHGIRRMPVVDHDGIVMGIVTLDDLLAMVADEANALVQVNRRGQKQERQARR
ncbi:MAG: CBS domain-containing protein [Steroidobacteraceae bacterium]